MGPIIQKFHNERIDLAEASSINKPYPQNIDEDKVVSCVRNYFSNPKTVDKETYQRISNQMISIFRNCPALIHQNNFSATISLYGYNIPLNVCHVKHDGDTTPTEFINADSGSKMSDDEQQSFLSNFEGDHNKQVLRTTKNQMYSSLTKHITSIKKLPFLNLNKHELEALKTDFKDPCCFIHSELEQTLIDMIRKVGEYNSHLVYNTGQFKVSIGKPVQVNSTVDELKQNEPTVPDAPNTPKEGVKIKID